MGFEKREQRAESVYDGKGINKKRALCLKGGGCN